MEYMATLTCLHGLTMQTWSSMSWYIDVILKRERLPPVLYLQLDNTARENKNKYVMAFLAYLVQAGVFKEVSYRLVNFVL